MSVSHFYRQNPYSFCSRLSTLSRGLICSSLSPPPFLSALFFTNSKPIRQWRPHSVSSKVVVPPSYASLSSRGTPATQPFTSPYLLVHIRCPRDFADLLSESLLCFGASSTSMDEEDGCKSSDEVSIDCIFPEREDVNECISLAADTIGLKDVLIYEVKMGEQCDWIKKTQESFHPVQVTEGLWVVPEWRSPPDVQAINIILNPGLAFGTGEHPSTRLCLLLLKDVIRGGEVFLDYGTGSGVLAIAAIKFGATLSVGVDIDPLAITSAGQNATLNNIGHEKIQLHIVPSKTSPASLDEKTHGFTEEHSSFSMESLSETKVYDVVIANILLNPLLELADHIASYARPGGVIGISGILSEQLPQIINRYSQFMEGISVSEMDGWACVKGLKKRNFSEN